MLEVLHKRIKEGQGFLIEGLQGLGKVGFKEDLKSFLKMGQKRVRRANPIAAGMADYVNWVLYDRIAFAANTTIPNLNKLFIVPIGGNSKTKVDTNLTQVSRLEDPYWMNVTAVCCYINPNVALVDLNNFLNTTYIEFYVGPSKTYIEGPVQCFPSAAGVWGNTSFGTMTAAAGNSSTNVVNGWPDSHNAYDLRLPAGIGLGRDANGSGVVTDGYTGITILQGQSFHLEIKADAGGATLLANNTTPVAGTGLTFACYLHGILSRGVY